MDRIRNQDPDAIKRARKLRRTASESEDRLWRYLRSSRIGFKARRQFPLGPYTLDFFIHEANLCIEVDGEIHELKHRSDKIRDAYLREQGIETVRIPSLDMFTDIYPWARTIYGLCVERTGRNPIPDF